MTLTIDQADRIRQLWYIMDGPSDRPRQVSEWAEVVEGLLRIVGEITGIDSAAAISPMELAAPGTNGTTVFIRNQFNSWLTRFGCTLCGGTTEKQSYLFRFRLPDSDDNGIACDRCAENPQDIPVNARQEIQSLKQRIADLEFLAGCTYVTEVVPAPEDVHNEGEFRPWMRERLGLPFRYAESADGERVWLP